MFEEEDRHKKQRNEREIELLTVRQIMKNENGRAFMWRSLQNCHTFENIFTGDHVQDAYKSGKRSQGLWLDEEIREAAPEDYYKMLKENR